MTRARRFLVVYACLASCSGGTRPASESANEPPRPLADRPPSADAAPPPPRPTGPYVVTPGLESGQIAGMVTLANDPAAPAPAKNACGGRAAERLVRTPAGGVSGVLLWADVRKGRAQDEASTVDVALRGCRYEPAAAMVTRSGSRLRIANEDPIRHVFTVAYTGAGGGDAPEAIAEIPAPLEGQRFEVVLDRVGIFRLGCALHADERAWVAVPEHPYHVVSDADGRFTIDGVPAGTVRLVGWHPPIADGGRPLRGELAVDVVRGSTVDGSLKLE